jgi:hypothetical protein
MSGFQWFLVAGAIYEAGIAVAEIASNAESVLGNSTPTLTTIANLPSAGSLVPAAGALIDAAASLAFLYVLGISKLRG